MTLLPRGPEAIGPTAYYTGYAWARHGLGPRKLAIAQGWLLCHGIQPVLALSGVLGGPTREGFLRNGSKLRLVHHSSTAFAIIRRATSVLLADGGVRP